MPGSFMVDLESTRVSAEERKILAHPNVGSVILFTRNFENPEQLKSLLADVRSIRPDIFVAIDHEGGIVQRFQRHGFRSIPAARVYGETYDINPEAGIELARRFGQHMAEDLLRYGIDLSLAPVVDLHDSKSQVIGRLDRAFHKKPEVVKSLAGAFIEGMNGAGMPAVGKHFPGHGTTVVDSHVGQPTCDKTEEELMATDLKPFIDLMAEGKLSGVMPAHITYTKIDSENIASFSRIWLQDILRRRFEFKGVTISDSLSMKGADVGDLRTRSELALRAGCDMLILCNQSRGLTLETLNTVQFEQSPESAQRIRAFKEEMKRFKSDNVEHLQSQLGVFERKNSSRDNIRGDGAECENSQTARFNTDNMV